jgi:hypothetical protein
MPRPVHQFPYTDVVIGFSDRPLQQTVVVRKVSLQAVGRISLLFAICLWAVLLLASVLLWQAAGVTGLLDNFESFWAEATGQESVSLSGSALLMVVVLGGLVLVAVITLVHVMFAVLFNSICDLTGGVPVGIERLGSGGLNADRPTAMPAPPMAGTPRPSARAPQPARKWPLRAWNR